MKYYLDTEFIEGFHKPLFGKKRHFIDLISIGIVAEDGRTYYAISSEYNYNDADYWVKENVILPLYLETVHGDHRNYWNVNNFHRFFGKSNKQIAEEIKAFINNPWPLERKEGFDYRSDPEFYAYYADYDWVVFCSLFGRMIDLPKGFPMYCRDLKQILDEKQSSRERLKGYIEQAGDVLKKHEEHALVHPLNLKEQENYPKQENEHNALADAKWNQKLHQFLQSI